jgi:fructose-1-phosphate kinase PfkB-like protein
MRLSHSKMPIVTLTANLVAETTYYVDDWGPGKTSRATKERFQVGGKGINVSKMLVRLNADTTAVCFPGGSFGPSCTKSLEAEDIPFKAFTTDCVTRSGSIIRSPGSKEISILGIDCQVSKRAVQDCIEYLSKRDRPYILAVCGVFPNWDSETWDPLRDWLGQRKKSINLAVDTYGPGLKWFVQQSPALVKINRDELEMFFENDASATPTDSLLDQLEPKYDCPQWIITDGENPIWIKIKNAPCVSLQPRPAKCVSPIGCGDVFFATLLNGIVNHPETGVVDTVRLAAEYASRNAGSHGIADFEIDQEDQTPT